MKYLVHFPPLVVLTTTAPFPVCRQSCPHRMKPAPHVFPLKLAGTPGRKPVMFRRVAKGTPLAVAKQAVGHHFTLSFTPGFPGICLWSLVHLLALFVTHQHRRFKLSPCGITKQNRNRVKVCNAITASLGAGGIFPLGVMLTGFGGHFAPNKRN